MTNKDGGAVTVVFESEQAMEALANKVLPHWTEMEVEATDKGMTMRVQRTMIAARGDE